jgi:drug/metabolite transporter (DMT)-like permease
MIWIILLLGHLIGIVGYTLILRRIHLGKLDQTLTSALMMTAVWLPSLFLLAAGKVNFNLSSSQLLFLGLGGFMVAGLMITNVWALRHLDASMFTILYNIRLLTLTIFGYLIFHERPKNLQLLGGVIIFLSILALNLHKDKKWKSKPILIGLFAMTWFSVHALVEKQNIKTNNFETYVFMFGAIGTLLMWMLVAYKAIDVSDQIKHIRDRKIYLLLVTRCLSAWGFIYALKYGSLAVTGYVSGMSVALIVLFGIYVLRETEQKRQKLTAVGIACIGLTLILVSRLS